MAIYFRLHYLMNGGDVTPSVVNPQVNSKFFPNIPSIEKGVSCRVCVSIIILMVVVMTNII